MQQNKENEDRIRAARYRLRALKENNPSVNVADIEHDMDYFISEATKQQTASTKVTAEDLEKRDEERQKNAGHDPQKKV
jgi:hypothetical protein